jgi:gephyrin
VPLDPRAEYHRVFLRPSPLTGTLKAFSTGGQRSSRTVSLAGANGLLELPALEKGGKDRIEEGKTVQCVVIGEIGSLAA